MAKCATVKACERRRFKSMCRNVFAIYKWTMASSFGELVGRCSRLSVLPSDTMHELIIAKWFRCFNISAPKDQKPPNSNWMRLFCCIDAFDFAPSVMHFMQILFTRNANLFTRWHEFVMIECVCEIGIDTFLQWYLFCFRSTGCNNFKPKRVACVCVLIQKHIRSELKVGLTSQMKSTLPAQKP